MYSELWGTTATPLEILWFCLSLLGTIISVNNLHHSMKARAYLEVLEGNGLLRLAADALAVQEGLRVASQVMFLSIGVIAISTHPSQWFGRFIGWMLVAAICLLISKSAFATYTRKKIISYKGSHPEEKGG